MNWRTRFTAHPAIGHGKACIKGTRIMASVVLDSLAAGQSLEDLVRLYPTLQLEDVTAVIAYAAEVTGSGFRFALRQAGTRAQSPIK
jgi:uncharacterized protein (DUF433 family)